MVDRYLSGRVNRISPEAPVPVLRYGAEDNRLGGAANVALNLLALGAETHLIGAVGDDENGRLVADLMTAAGLSPDRLVTDPDRQTTVKTRLVAGGQQLLRVDREDTHDVIGASAGAVSARVQSLLDEGGVDVLLLQDYNKGVLPAYLIADLISRARAAAVPVVVDPKDRNFWAYRGCTLFKPNLREMQQQLDFPLTPDPASLDRAAALLFDRLGCDRAMITLGEHGIYVNDGTTSALIPTAARTVADVSGAGDTVVAITACAQALGWELPRIAELANRAGAQVIAQSGVVAVDWSKLKEEKE